MAAALVQPDPRFDPSFLKPGRPNFRVAPSSESQLASIAAGLQIKGNGAPKRRYWDHDGRLGDETGIEAGSTGVSFRIRLVPLDGYDPKVAGRPPPLPDPRGPNTLAAEAAKAEAAKKAAEKAEKLGLPIPQPDAAKPITKVEKYYAALLKAEKLRNDTENKRLYDEQIAKDQAAAERTKKAMIDAEGPPPSRSSSESEKDSDEEVEEDSEDEIPPLRPYDGVMKLDIEIVVRPAPGEKQRSDNADDTPPSTATPTSTKSSESTPRMNLAEELQDLADLIEESEESDDSDGLPEGLGVAMSNIYDAPDPRLCLGIGGTVFFMPDAERYAHGPSLPPPPPPSLQGRRRLRLKPRLPLDISNHRYRDEHPNIWPDPPYTPDIERILEFERKLLTLDFYKCCNSALSQIPQMSFAKDGDKHKEAMGKIIDREIKQSLSWKEYIHREQVKKKEADRIEKEAAEREEKEAEAKKKEDRRKMLEAAGAEEREMYVKSGDDGSGAIAPTS